jgi:small subunit ribosomal protein S15
MALTAAAKAQIVKTHKQSKSDTGSPEVQIALLTARINYLTDHLKGNKNDKHTRFGLTKMVSQRRSLMRYLKTEDSARYQSIIKALDIRG